MALKKERIGIKMIAKIVVICLLLEVSVFAGKWKNSSQTENYSEEIVMDEKGSSSVSEEEAFTGIEVNGGMVIELEDDEAFELD